MLRISTQEAPGEVTLRLEGSLTGPWVPELEDAWRAINAKDADRSISLDLTAVDQVDCAGRYLLALLRDRGVRLIASGLVMTDTVSSIVEEWRIKNDERV